METLTVQSAKRHCRICLHTDSTAPELWHHLQESPLKDWIRTLTPLQLDAELYPQYVCGECFGILKRFNELQTLVVKTSTILDALFMEIVVPEELITEIKQEQHAEYLETEVHQQESDPLQYINEEKHDDEVQDIKLTFEAEETTLIQPIQKNPDNAIRFSEKPKKISAKYRILERTNFKSHLWDVFAKVQNSNNGTLIENFVHCRSCGKLLKFNSKQLGNLVRHKCYILRKRNIVDSRNSHSNSTKRCQRQIQVSAKEKLSKKKKIVLVENEDHKNEDVLKAESEITEQDENISVVHSDSPTSDPGTCKDIETNEQVLQKIITGTYKISEKTNVKSRIWTVFAEVKKNDDTTIKNLVYCRSCGLLLKYNTKQVSNLVRHECYRLKKCYLFKDKSSNFPVVNNTTAGNQCLKRKRQVHNEDPTEVDSTTTGDEDLNSVILDSTTGDFTESKEEILRKISSGFYKITEKINARSRIWRIFGEIKRNDGVTIKGQVYCCSCDHLLKYSKKITSNLFRHKCYINMLKHHNIPVKRTHILNKIVSLAGNQCLKRKREVDNEVPREEDSTTTGDEDINSVSLDSTTGDFIESNEEILRKIKSGFYKITEKINGKSRIWKIFGEIKRNDGVTIKGQVYCCSCDHLLKYSNKNTTGLVRHNCYINMLKHHNIPIKPTHMQNKNLKQIIQVSASGKSMETETLEEVLNKISAGTYTISTAENIESPIWSVVYGEVRKTDGTKIENYIYCRVCHRLMKFNGKRTSNLVKHSCYINKTTDVTSKKLEEYKKIICPTTTKLDSNTGELIETHEEVLDKIFTGVYKISERKKGNIQIWTIFRLVTKEDGAVIKDIVYCSYCRQLLMWNEEDTSTLVEHTCYASKIKELNPVTVELNETYKEVLDKITAGSYIISEKPKENRRIWNVFGEIKKDDGTKINGIVYCRSCCQLMKFNRKQIANLIRHNCYVSKMHGCESIARRAFLKIMHNKYKKQVVPVSGPKKLKFLESALCEDVYKKLSTGEYKITEENDTRLTWIVFRKVKRNDKSIVKGVVYCSICTKLVRYNGKQTSNLVRHKCYLKKREGYVPPLTHNKYRYSGELAQTYEEEDGSRKKSKIADLTARTQPINPYEDTIIIDEPYKDAPEIRRNISAGIYTITPKENSKSPIWKFFGQIKKPDGSFLEDIVCCRFCYILKPYTRTGSSSLVRHQCASKRKRDDMMAKSELHGSSSIAVPAVPANFNIETYQEINSNIKSGKYKIVERKNGFSKIWTVFGIVQRQDGSIIKGFAYCRVCGQLKKYNGLQTTHLGRHDCYLSVKSDKTS